MQRPAQFPTVIVGGGLAGLFAALELALSNDPPTLVVVDSGTIGHGASWAAAGLLAPVHELEPTEWALTPAGFAAQQLHYDWIARLGWQVGLARTGALEVALTAADLPYVQRRYEQQRAHGLRVEWLAGAALYAREPALARTVPAGIYTPDDAQLEPRALVTALIATLSSLGVQLRPDTRVSAIEAEGEHLVVMTAREPIRARGVILATGALPPPAVPGFTPEAVTPVRGQMISLDPPAGGLVRHPIRLQSRAWGYGYLVPKADRLIVGSTSEEQGLDPRLTAGGLYDVLRRAYAAYPAIYDLPVIETWSGFRPATTSRLPQVQRHPTLNLVWVNGLYRHGILLSPLMGRAAAWALLGRALPPEVAALQHSIPA